MGESRSVLSSLGKSNLLRQLSSVLGHVSITSRTNEQLHSRLFADPHFDHGTVRTFRLSPPLRVTFAVSWLYAGMRMGMSIPWLNPGTQVGRVSYGTRTPQCIGNTAGLLVREANPRELGGQWGGRGWDFYSFTGLYCFLKFSQPHSETHAGLSVGKGKDSVLFSMVSILSYMQYALWNGCCFELQS